MSYPKLSPLNSLGSLNRKTIAQQPSNAANRFVELNSDLDLVAFHAAKEVDQAESLENETYEIEDDDDFLPITDAEPAEIVDEILQTERLPEGFFDEEGKLKDIELVRQTLLELAKDFKYEDPASRQIPANIATENSPAATLARILINSIPVSFIEDVNRNIWADDPNSRYYHHDTHPDWRFINGWFLSLHTSTPLAVPAQEGSEEDLIRVFKNISAAPLFYYAQSVLRNGGSEKNMTRVIMFFNNLNKLSALIDSHQ